jgi:glycosyltransferase involved in cell wall biosynthesis
LTVLFDVTCLIPEQLSGIGVYTQHLFRSLRTSGMELTPVYKSSRLLKKSAIGDHIGEPGLPFVLARIRSGQGPIVLHGPDFRLLTSSSRYIKIVTVHDLAVFQPDFNSQDFRENGQKRMTELVEKDDPDLIIVPSQAIHDELVARWSQLAGRVRVVHHGADHLVAGDCEPSIAPATQPYFLYVGHIENRKNLGRVISAFEKICETDQDLKLIIVGKDGFNASAYHQQIERSPFRDRIERTGFVDNTNLQQLYTQARAFVFPSLYEGFGFPILEAMALGCSVITSNFGAMKEVAGDAALLVDPHSDKAIARAMTTLHHDQSLRKQQVARGHQRVKEFTWKSTAFQVAQLYQEFASRRDNDHSEK